MSRTNSNIIVRGFSGRLDHIVLKNYSYGTVMGKMPNMSSVKKSELQLSYERLFKKAVFYAKSIIEDPVQKKAYQKTLRKGKSVYHAAIKEYLRKNKVQKKS